MPQNIKVKLIEAEVYSRVVGYYRPVNNWNKGKKQEFKDRKFQTFQKEEKMGTFKLIRRGVHRPMTMGLQVALGIKDDNYYGPRADGFFGEETEKALLRWQLQKNLSQSGILDKATFEALLPDIPLEYLIFELIACFEVDMANNAWGYSGDCGDGNGVNYGPMQLNRAMGSVQLFSKKYLPAGEVFAEFFGTSRGAQAQMRYFLDVQLDRAKNSIEEIFSGQVVPTPRLLGLLIDGSIQGGAPLPEHPVREKSLQSDWPEGEVGEAWLERIREFYKGIEYDETEKVHVAFKASIDAAISLGISPEIAYAELHPRSGVHKYLADQLSRRRLWTTGKGIVHDDPYDLSDFGI